MIWRMRNEIFETKKTIVMCGDGGVIKQAFSVGKRLGGDGEGRRRGSTGFEED